MHARQAKPVFDLSERLPSYGENRVNIRFDGADLIVDVLYDGPDDSPEQSLTLAFKDVCCFHFSSVPGVSLLNIEYEKSSSLGDLVEFEDSDAAKAWTEHFSISTIRIRHFQAFFLSANNCLEVFAEEFSCSSAS